MQSGAVRSIDVPAEGMDLTVSLWRRQPDILPLRPVYPGANLVDARFLADGTVALSVSLPGGSSAAQQSARELWQLDPVTGSMARVTLADPAAVRAPLVALAPDGQKVAYLVQGSAGVSASLWPASGSAPVRGAASRPAGSGSPHATIVRLRANSSNCLLWGARPPPTPSNWSTSSGLRTAHTWWPSRV